MAPERNVKSVPNGLQDTVVHPAQPPRPCLSESDRYLFNFTELAVLDPINAVA